MPKQFRMFRRNNRGVADYLILEVGGIVPKLTVEVAWASLANSSIERSIGCDRHPGIDKRDLQAHLH